MHVETGGLDVVRILAAKPTGTDTKTHMQLPGMAHLPLPGDKSAVLALTTSHTPFLLARSTDQLELVPSI